MYLVKYRLNIIRCNELGIHSIPKRLGRFVLQEIR